MFWEIYCPPIGPVIVRRLLGLRSRGPVRAARVSKMPHLRARSIFPRQPIDCTANAYSTRAKPRKPLKKTAIELRAELASSIAVFVVNANGHDPSGGLRSNGLEQLDLFCESFSSDVEASLDCSDRSIKGFAHLDQGLAFEIKCRQCFAIDVT